MGLDYTFEDYKEKLPFPNKADFTIVHGYKAGVVVFSIPLKDITDELKASASITENVTDKEAYEAARAAFRAETAALNEKFRDDLYDEYGVTGHPKAAMVFDKAWERGHSEGLENVANHFSDLVELIQ
jgi:hypothetical protein